MAGDVAMTGRADADVTPSAPEQQDLPPSSGDNGEVARNAAVPGRAESAAGPAAEPAAGPAAEPAAEPAAGPAAEPAAAGVPGPAAPSEVRLAYGVQYVLGGAGQSSLESLIAALGPVFLERLRAVGEHPKAAETVGIDVIRLRYRNVILGGLFAGLAGAWFTLDYGNSFQPGMTNGRGFIALAALIFGRWHPIGAVAASLLFASALSLGTAIRTTPPIGDLGSILGSIPEQVFAALPYVVTIVVLAGVVGRSVPPAAVGRPYKRESTA